MPGHIHVMMSKDISALCCSYHGQPSGRLWRTGSGSPPALFLPLDAERPIFWIFANLQVGSVEVIRQVASRKPTFEDQSMRQEMR